MGDLLPDFLLFLFSPVFRGIQGATAPFCFTSFLVKTIRPAAVTAAHATGRESSPGPNSVNPSAPRERTPEVVQVGIMHIRQIFILSGAAGPSKNA